MKSRLCIILLCLTAGVNGQNFKYPHNAKKSERISDFIPKGWHVLDSASGDLNRDSHRDMVLILQFNDTIVEVDPDHGDSTIYQPRMMRILFLDATDRKYFIKEQSNTFILPHDNPYMDDPFDGVGIHNNVLSVNFRIWYSWGSWWTSSSTHKFRFDKNEFRLIGFDSWSMHRATMETKSYSLNFLTGKYSVTVEEGETDSEEEADSESNNEREGTKSNTVWKTFKLEGFKTLKSLQRPYMWNFVDDIAI